MAKHLRERIQSLEDEQTELLDKLNSMQERSKGPSHNAAAKALTKKKP